MAIKKKFGSNRPFFQRNSNRPFFQRNNAESHQDAKSQFSKKNNSNNFSPKKFASNHSFPEKHPSGRPFFQRNDAKSQSPPKNENHKFPQRHPKPQYSQKHNEYRRPPKKFDAKHRGIPKDSANLTPINETNIGGGLPKDSQVSEYPQKYPSPQYPQKYNANSPPKKFDANRFPKKFDANRPPKKFDANRSPKKFDASRPPKKFDAKRGIPKDSANLVSLNETNKASKISGQIGNSHTVKSVNTSRIDSLSTSSDEEEEQHGESDSFAESEISEGDISDTESSESDIEVSTENDASSDYSAMSMGELLNLQEKMGTKAFREKVLNVNKKTKKEVPGQVSYKRLNKNRPSEQPLMRKRASRMMFLEKGKEVRKQISRDPRFDNLSGDLSLNTWDDKYEFLRDIRKKETEILKNELEEEVDTDKIKMIKQTLQRMKNQEREGLKRRQERQVQAVINKETKAALRKGLKPRYISEKEKKLMLKTIQFEKLKENNKVGRYLERKEKKQANKERMQASNFDGRGRGKTQANRGRMQALKFGGRGRGRTQANRGRKQASKY